MHINDAKNMVNTISTLYELSDNLVVQFAAGDSKSDVTAASDVFAGGVHANVVSHDGRHLCVSKPLNGCEKEEMTEAESDNKRQTERVKDK